MLPNDEAISCFSWKGRLLRPVPYPASRSRDGARNDISYFFCFQFSGRRERTAAPARHISDSRIAFSSASSFTL
jgi:hypothetical protein